MAFNPFEVMRKRGKMILSVVTICIMFIFVLSSGIAGSDFFNDIVPRVFGGRGKTSGTTVAEGFGEKITGNDIGQTKILRRAANAYMILARNAADDALIRQVDQQMDKFSDETKKMMQATVEARRKSSDPRLSDKERTDAYRRYQELIRPDVQFAMQLGRPDFAFFNYTRRLEQLELNADKNQREMEAVATAKNVFVRDIERLQPRNFFVWPNDTDADAIDFILMKRKADKEGIKLPKEQLDNLVASDLGTTLSIKDTAAIERALFADPRFRTMRSDDLVKALTDEYRVKFVLESNFPVLGRQKPIETPYDFYEFYRDQTAEAKFAFVEVPVKNFLEKVKELPNPDDLKKLFASRKTFEQDPTIPEPGFKEGRKFKVEFIATDPKAKMYVEGGPVLHAVAMIGAGLQPGGGPIQALVGVSGPALAENYAIESEVDKIRQAERDTNSWSEWSSNGIHDSNVYNPLPIAALTAQLLNPISPARAFSAVAAFQQQAAALEVRDRVKIGASLALAGFMGSNKFALLEAIPASLAMIPPELPSAVYAGPIRKRFAEQEVQHLYSSDTNTFMAKVGVLAFDLTPKTDPAKAKKAKEEAIKVIVDFANARGLKIVSATEPHDRFTIDADPNLKPLDEEKPPHPDFQRPGFKTAMQQFFWLRTNDARQMQDPRQQVQYMMIPEAEATLYRPNWFPRTPLGDESTKQNFIAWVTEDIPAKSYLNYDLASDAIKKRVQEAWKFAKARELAKKAADDLDAKIHDLAKKELTAPEKDIAFRDALREFVRPLNYPYKGEVTVSELKFQPGTNPNDTGGNYVRNLAIPSDIVELPGQMALALVADRDKALGTTEVIPDQPQNAYYLATLMSKKDKSLKDFESVYRRSSPKAATDTDPFYASYFLPKSFQEIRQEFHDRLHAEAKFKMDAKQAEEANRPNSEPIDEN